MLIERFDEKKMKKTYTINTFWSSNPNLAFDETWRDGNLCFSVRGSCGCHGRRACPSCQGGTWQGGCEGENWTGLDYNIFLYYFFHPLPVPILSSPSAPLTAPLQRRSFVILYTGNLSRSFTAAALFLPSLHRCPHEVPRSPFSPRHPRFGAV